MSLTQQTHFYFAQNLYKIHQLQFVSQIVAIKMEITSTEKDVPTLYIDLISSHWVFISVLCGAL